MANTLGTILNEVYGVGELYADTCTVLWATERIADKAEAKKELSRLNRLRQKYGRPPAYAPYGHHAF